MFNEGQTSVTINRSRTLFAQAALAFAVMLLFLTGARADPPKLTEDPQNELRKTYQAGQKYTIRMLYTDPAGDEITKSKAQFIDEAPSGRVATAATSIEGDTKTGAVITWDINGFEQGGHTAHFEVDALTGKVRYPAEATENYTFVVEAIGTKIIIMMVGLVIGLAALPLLTYVLFRSANPRGDPSRVARVGLLIGILACCALFIYLFLSIYGPLVYAILGVGIFAGLILMLRR
jgi:hypothetical protein